MTFLQQLQAHKGGLLYLKTELFWYSVSKHGDGDCSEDRICLLLDANGFIPTYRSARTMTVGSNPDSQAAAQLLIDGVPHWVWLYEDDVEVLNEEH